VVGVVEDMSDGEKVSGQKTTPADDASVHKGASIGCFPLMNKVIILLIVHLIEVAHEERGDGWTRKTSEM
jgi:hypothetical protein